MGLRIVQVDAFTAKPFAGNPAAVCVLAHAADKKWMQQVAREMNLSETAFLFRDGGAWNLRWFTPTVEMDLCGHATLASAHVLWEDGHLQSGTQARFDTRSGRLTADQSGQWIEMDFPSQATAPAAPPDGLFKALGAEGKYVGKNGTDYLVEVENEAVVRGLTPNFTALRSLPISRGVIVTARASSAGFDFVSRFFAPAAGVDEDPVTGSAHCALAPFWSERIGRTSLVGYQASARGGVVAVRVSGNRVILGGQAITVLRGELTA